MDLTISTRALRGLLDPLQHLAADRGDAPILNAVRLYVDGLNLVGIATDRYAVGMLRQVGDWPEGFAATIPLDAVRSILRQYRPRRGEDPDLTLSVGSHNLLVKAAGGFLDFDGASTTYALASGEFPDLAKVIRTALANDVDPSAMAAFNFKFLARFAHFERLGGGLMVRVTSPRQPAVITDGERFIGALMPKRTDVTAFEDFAADVLPLIAEKAAAKKPAPKRTARKKATA